MFSLETLLPPTVQKHEHRLEAVNYQQEPEVGLRPGCRHDLLG